MCRLSSIVRRAYLSKRPSRAIAYSEGDGYGDRELTLTVPVLNYIDRNNAAA